jgi:nicotinamidase-related amidase
MKCCVKMKPLLIIATLFVMILTTPALAAVETPEKTIVDEWTSVRIPVAPELKPVALEVSSTAFLILDIQEPLCTKERPRCVISVPKIASFLALAREKGMAVVYSTIPNGIVEQILPAIAPLSNDPSASSGVDKFYNTDLEKILKEKGIKTVVIVGTAANGAVLHTAVGAAIRGLQVVIPVDGMSTSDPYAEQYTAWHMMNGPGTRNRATITKFSLITFK